MKWRINKIKLPEMDEITKSFFYLKVGNQGKSLNDICSRNTIKDSVIYYPDLSVLEESICIV